MAYKKKIETEVIEEEVKVEEPKIIKEKKFSDDDLIPCQSVTIGGLYIEGIKSKDLYEFTTLGDVVDITYADLMAMLRKKDNMMFYPRFVVIDPDFVKQNSILEEFYNGQYTQEDFDIILNNPINIMAQQIDSLPAGVKDAFKGYAMSLIEDGELDSVQKIKEIDKIFDTSMLLRMTQ